MVGSSPQHSAYLSMKHMNTKQANLANAVGGRTKRKYRGGIAGNVVPVFHNMPYKSTNGPGQQPNDLIVGNSKTGIQGTENRKMDDGALSLKGGKIRISRKSRKSKKGGKSRKYRR
jgi:hypothetical protein